MKTNKILTVFILLLTVFTLTGCGSKYKFKTPYEAINGCRQMLNDLRGKKEVSSKELAKIIANWQEIQDSCYSVFSKDSTVQIHSDVANQYFAVSDSIRNQINRIAASKQYTLEDIVYIKIHTAKDKDKIHNSAYWKKAVKFYESLDDNNTYASTKETIMRYQNLVNSAPNIRNKQQLLYFITEEDKCFRSLLGHLRDVPQAVLQDITAKTGNIFNNLYDRVGVKQDSINDETMLLLTLRFNRRIVQNAVSCQSDIDKGMSLSSSMKANYRWMLLQPFITIDNYSFACLTDDQMDELEDIAKHMPDYLTFLDGENSTEEQRKNLVNILSNYFLKNYLMTTI